MPVGQLILLCTSRGQHKQSNAANGSSDGARTAEIGWHRRYLERGADINRTRQGRPHDETARRAGHRVMSAWLKHVREASARAKTFPPKNVSGRAVHFTSPQVGWTRYLSEPRYALVVLREQVARGQARRERAMFGREQVLDFLFPPGEPAGEPGEELPPPPPPRAKRRAQRRRLPCLPKDLFPLVACYYWGGDPWSRPQTTEFGGPWYVNLDGATAWGRVSREGRARSSGFG